MTSEHLLSRFPILAEKAGWKKFADAFDKQACVKRRIKVAEEGKRPPTGDVRIQKMRRAAHEILFPELLAVFGTEEIELDSLVSARKLASMVTSLLSNSPDGRDLRAAVAAEGKHLDFKPKDLNGFDAMQCLIGFIDREYRLPTKKELRIECQHWHSSGTFISNKKMSYGERIGKKGDQIWRVISCRSDTRFNSKNEIVPCYTLVLTGEATWGKERWNSSEFSATQKGFGLDGLPEGRGRPKKS